MDTIIAQVADILDDLMLDAELQFNRSEFTPAGSSKIEARFSGPDANVLRAIAEQTLNVYLAHELIDRKTDWRQRELQIVPKFDEARARVAGITRADVYRSLAFATLGVQVGLFRDADKLLPIVARAPEIGRAGQQEGRDRNRMPSSA